MTSSKKRDNGRSMLGLLLAGLLMLLLIFRKGKTTSGSTVTVLSDDFGSGWFTDETGKTFNIGSIPNRIINAFTNDGYSLKVAQWWVAISKFETANFRSNLAINYNNLFGMKVANKRPRDQAGASPSGFASYDSWAQSIRDQLLYLKYFNYPKDFESLQDLVAFMKSKGYFEEPLSVYLSGVKTRL